MMSTLRERSDRSQNGFGADLLEALEACAELINTGRSAGGDGMSFSTSSRLRMKQSIGLRDHDASVAEGSAMALTGWNAQ